MYIEAKVWGGCEHFNITGGKLRYKFSILEKNGDYFATASQTNSELIQFLDSLKYMNNKYEYNNYYWWKINPGRVITVMNAVIREFGSCKQ